MIIEKLEYSFKDKNNFKNKNFYKKTLVFSKENSKGKTTFIRALLYAFGFPISSTRHVNFNNLEFILHIKRKNVKLTLHRYKNEYTLKINKNEEKYFLPSDLNLILSKIFDTSELKILKNILGTFYFDQEKGWTLLNRGYVCGKIRFDIVDWLQAFIKDDQIIDLITNINERNNEKENYKYIKSLCKLQEKISEEKQTFENENNSCLNNLTNKKNKLLYKINLNKNKQKELEKTINENISFVDQIENMKLSILHNDEIIRVTKNNLYGNYNINELCKARLNKLKFKTTELKNELSKIDYQINNLDIFDDNKSLLKNYQNKIMYLNCDKDKINNEIKNLNKEIKEKNKILDEYQVDKISEMYTLVSNYCKRLGIDDEIDNNKNFILTKNLITYSGMTLRKIVFAFKLAYVKITSEFLDLKLPIIMDSPRSETSNKSISKMINILKEDFVDHQIIIGSIYDYDLPQLKKIEMDKTFFDEKLPLYDNTEKIQIKYTD